MSLGLPALSRAVKLQRRAARVGFDWRELAEVLDKVAEELEEVRVEVAVGAGRDRLSHEIGDLLLASSNLARFAGIDPESALREANNRFERRFRRIEDWLAIDARPVRELSLDDLIERRAASLVDYQDAAYAKRYRTLVRAFNINRGMRRKDEKPPANHWKKRFPELEEQLLDAYYKLKGWPTPHSSARCSSLPASTKSNATPRRPPSAPTARRSSARSERPASCSRVTSSTGSASSPGRRPAAA